MPNNEPDDDVPHLKRYTHAAERCANALERVADTGEEVSSSLRRVVRALERLADVHEASLCNDMPDRDVPDADELAGFKFRGVARSVRREQDLAEATPTDDAAKRGSSMNGPKHCECGDCCACLSSIPDGGTCESACAHVARCKAIFGQQGPETCCLFIPSRLRLRVDTVRKDGGK